MSDEEKGRRFVLPQFEDNFWLGEQWHSHQCGNCGVIFDCWKSTCKATFRQWKCDVCSGFRLPDTGGD